MQKEQLKLVREERGLTYGGREVLRVVCDVPHGRCRAATHFKQITELWATFAERELFPVAAREWEEKARAGVGFSFRPHTARASIKATALKRGLKIAFSATLFVGDEAQRSHVLSTFWDRSGERQFKKPLRKSSR